jgi:hypothetical protein
MAVHAPQCLLKGLEPPQAGETAKAGIVDGFERDWYFDGKLRSSRDIRTGQLMAQPAALPGLGERDGRAGTIGGEGGEPGLEEAEIVKRVPHTESVPPPGVASIY